LLQATPELRQKQYNFRHCDFLHVQKPLKTFSAKGSLAHAEFRAHKEMRDAANSGQRVSVPVLFVKQQRQFADRKPDPGKRKQENARAKAKLKAIKMGFELPKTAQPARYKANLYSACAKEPLAEKVFTTMLPVFRLCCPSS
jgi:hypothetical protein